MMESGMTSLVDRTGAKNADPDGAPQLPGYEILQKLAVGGMAEIFVAQKFGSPDVCVVKQLHAHLSEDSVVGARFLREAQVASFLNHRHIARLTDARRIGDKGRFYLAMEFIAGQDVETMMFRLMEQRKMLPPELSVTVTLDVLDGLHYAHDLRGPDDRPLEIVHRDLSPRNVMVTYEGRVKIIDFGLARTNLGDFRTAPGMVLGTMRYMSPEQAVAEPVDRRSDVYSWSVVLYEMLSGRPLVMGANAQEVLHAVVTQVPPPLSSLNPALPRALDAVLEKGLAKDRRDRFSTAADLRSALIEAAGPLAALDDERHKLIGRFVTELFPNEYAETKNMLESLERGEGGYEPTRLGPAQHEVTRATYIQRVQSMQGAVEAHETKAQAPEIIPLAPPDPSDMIGDGPPTLRPAIDKDIYAAPAPKLSVSVARRPRPQSPIVLGMVAVAMFLAGGALVFMVTRPEEAVMITEADLPPQNDRAQARQLPSAAQQETKTTQPAQQKAPVEDKAIRVVKKEKQKERIDPEPPTKVAKSDLPEVKKRDVMYPEIKGYLEAAKKEIEARDPADDSDPKSLRLAADAIRDSASALPPERQSPVNGCVALMTFGGLQDRMKNTEKCYRKLEDAAK
jgi:serine/threonine protein kinase